MAKTPATTLEDLKKLILKSDKKIDNMVKSQRDLRKEVRMWKKNYEELNKVQAIHKLKIEILEKKIDFLINKERRKNLLFFKIEDSEEFNEKLNENLFVLLEKADIFISEQDIERIIRLGKNSGSRPVLIEFKNFQTKKNIFNKLEKLKELNIFIANDLTKEQRAKPKLTRDIYKKLKEQGFENVMRRKNKIILEGITYEAENLVSVFENNNNNTITEYSFEDDADDDDESDIMSDKEDEFEELEKIPEIETVSEKKTGTTKNSKGGKSKEEASKQNSRSQTLRSSNSRNVLTMMREIKDKKDKEVKDKKGDNVCK